VLRLIHRPAPVIIGVTAALAALTVGVGTAAGSSQSGQSPIYFGVSAPLTGPNAEYSGYDKQGMALALQQINGAGGVDGRKIQLIWEDDQDNPTQSVPVAQGFVSNPNIIAVLGSFSSTASMAASPIYERNKLVQYGYTNSSPLFTEGGTYMWAPGASQATSEVQQTQSVSKLGKKIAVFWLDTSWGSTTFGIFKQEAQKLGLDITYSANYPSGNTNFRPLLIRAKESNPTVIYDIGYDPDAAAILNQRKDVGLTVPFFAEQLTSTGLGLAGANAVGAYTTQAWFPTSTNPLVKDFTSAFEKKYHTQPGEFDAIAYDAVEQLAQAVKIGGATRQGVEEGLLKGTNFPSVTLGEDFRFQSDRRPAAPPAPPTVIVAKGDEEVLAPASLQISE
jgi:branched-chain amino acid transport system substrate-binding protein